MPIPTKPDSVIAALLDGLSARVDRGHSVVVAVGALLVAAVNLEVFIEQQWQLALFTVAAGALGGAGYLISGHSRWRSATVRRAAMCTMLLTVPLSMAGYGLLVAGRLSEDGPIIAVARFDGPKLPDPYADCRPSDMLTDALSDIAERYHRITAFELPYSVDPNGRWANVRASSNGFVQGADTLVYGEYSLVGDVHGSGRADRVLISPSVNRVPLMVSLGSKIAPLMEWDFPTRVVRIDELCGGNAERFLNDGRRLALAVSSLQLIATQNYEAAQAALSEAENLDPHSAALANDTAAERRNSRCDVQPKDPAAECSGVLAFYLAVIDARFGHYSRALREYAYAAGRLHRPAPHVDLGELYVALGHGSQALDEFRFAVQADPYSVAALATLAQYENSYGDPAAANDDLQRARSLPRRSGYDAVALSRALFQCGDANDRRAALALMKEAIDPPPLGVQLPAGQRQDAEIQYGRWLAFVEVHDDPQQRLDPAVRASFADVLAQNPMHVEANYQLGLALQDERNRAPAQAASERDALRAAAQRSFRMALDAPAFTDEELVDAGNAAFELGRLRVAAQRYQSALAINPGAAYAYSGLAKVHVRQGAYGLALADLRHAARLHPREVALQEALQAVLRQGRAERRGRASVDQIADDR